MADDEQFRRALYQAVAETETLLEPGDPRVVPLHQQRYGGDATEVNHDSVANLATAIRWSTTNTTMQLFSGFRGSGKTTELLRLRENLRADGYVVLYVRLEEYLNLKEPVELADFLLATLAAADDAAHGVSGDPNDPAPPPIPYDSSGEGVRRWWDRVKSLLDADSDQLEVTAKLGPVELKTEFRENPSFRQQVTRGQPAQPGGHEARGRRLHRRPGPPARRRDQRAGAAGRLLGPRRQPLGVRRADDLDPAAVRAPRDAAVDDGGARHLHRSPPTSGSSGPDAARCAC